MTVANKAGRHPHGDGPAPRRAVTQPEPLSALAVSQAVDASAHAHELSGISLQLRGIDRHLAWLDQTWCARNDGDSRGDELEVDFARRSWELRA